MKKKNLKILKDSDPNFQMKTNQRRNGNGKSKQKQKRF